MIPHRILFLFHYQICKQNVFLHILFSFIGLRVSVVFLLASTMASLFPGKSRWYLSLGPSIISSLNSCFKISKSIFFPSSDSTKAFGKRLAIFSMFSNKIFFFPYLIYQPSLLFLHLKLIIFTISFITSS